MKFAVSFLEPAQKELFDAVEYYDEQQSGLGFEFALEVQKSINRIIRYPNAWSKFSARTRKCHCNHFPYSIIYFLKESEIIIVAIMHSKRKPNYWKKRIEN